MTTAREAVAELREQLDHAKGDHLQHSLIVTVDNLEALVRWAEERIEDAEKKAEQDRWALTCELVEGDDVAVAKDLGFISEGARGTLTGIDHSGSDTYPYLVRFKSGRQYVFPRYELKRVR